MMKLDSLATLAAIGAAVYLVTAARRPVAAVPAPIMPTLGGDPTKVFGFGSYDDFMQAAQRQPTMNVFSPYGF